MDIIRQCWQSQNQRPSAAAIVEHLSELLNEETTKGENRNEEYSQLEKDYNYLTQRHANLQELLVREQEQARKVRAEKDDIISNLHRDIETQQRELTRALNFSASQQLHINTLQVAEQTKLQQKQLKKQLQYKKIVTVVLPLLLGSVGLAIILKVLH